MPTLISQTQTEYDEQSSGDDLSTTSITLLAGNAPVGVITENVDRRFVQVSLEGKRIHPSPAKVMVRCHLRERKTQAAMPKAKVSKAAIFKAKVSKPEKKVSKAEKKVLKAKIAKVAKKADRPIKDPNYTGTVKLLKQMQFDDLMEWRRIAFNK
jgi:hypothetical protein